MNNLFLPDDHAGEAGCRFATVAALVGEKARLQWDSEESASAKGYKRLASYTPVVGDRVLVLPISGTYLIIGKVK